jgi:uncharacterized membrane protein YfcA
LSIDDIMFVIAAFFLSAFLKGITGMGFSTICLGLIATFVDIKLAIPLVIFPSLSSNLLVMRDAGHFRIALKRFWVLFLSALPGLALGLWLLDAVANDTARVVLGVVLFLYGAWSLLGAAPELAPRWEKALNAPVGFVTGVVNGLTGSQVMPVLPYFVALKLEKDLFVQSINISFTASSLVMLLGLSHLGLLSWPIAGISAVGIPLVALGIWLGAKVRRRIPDALFTKLVLGLLMLLGLNLMAKMLW